MAEPLGERGHRRISVRERDVRPGSRLASAAIGCSERRVVDAWSVHAVGPCSPWSGRSSSPDRLLERRIGRAVVARSTHRHRPRPCRHRDDRPAAPDTCPGSGARPPRSVSTGTAARPSCSSKRSAGARGCLDVVTFTFRTRGDGTPPGYTVGYRDDDAAAVRRRRPAHRDRRAGERDLLGHRSRPRRSTDPTRRGTARSTYAGQPVRLALRRAPPPPDRAEAARRRRRRAETVNWVIGLDSVRPFRVDRAKFREPGVSGRHRADRVTRTQVRSSTMLPNTRVGREQVVGGGRRRRAAKVRAIDRATTSPLASSGTTSRTNACGGGRLLLGRTGRATRCRATCSRLNMSAPRSSWRASAGEHADEHDAAAWRRRPRGRSPRSRHRPGRWTTSTGPAAAVMSAASAVGIEVARRDHGVVEPESARPVRASRGCARCRRRCSPVALASCSAAVPTPEPDRVHEHHLAGLHRGLVTSASWAVTNTSGTPPAVDEIERVGDRRALRRGNRERARPVRRHRRSRTLVRRSRARSTPAPWSTTSPANSSPGMSAGEPGGAA